MIATQLVQTALILYLTFVPYTNDKIGSCFNAVMPKVHYALAVILFVIMPMLVFLANALMRISGAEPGLLMPYFTLFAVLSCVLLV